MNSTFVLSRYYHAGARRAIATKLYRQVINYFSSLNCARQALTRIIENADKSVFYYVIEEFSCDETDVEIPQSISIRSYDSEGSLNDYSLIPEQTVGVFHGREPERIKFRIGDSVRYLDTNNCLRLGIVARLPLSSEEYTILLKKYKNGLYLDRSDDCYCVLDASKDRYGHAHPQCWAVFPIKKVRTNCLQMLRHKLEDEQGAYKDTNTDKYSFYYPYDDPFDYKPEFINKRRGLKSLEDLKYYKRRRIERINKESSLSRR